MPDLPAPVNVDVCIATWQRPQGLGRLLDALVAQRFTGIAAPYVRIVVVDNDVAASAQTVVEAHRTALDEPLDVAYVVEARRGIATVRNRAVAELRPDVDFVAFIDDDEIPEPDWLAMLLDVQARFEADAVAGPVVPRFDDPEIAEWIQRSGLHERARYATGTRLEVAGTGNVLIRARDLRRVPRPFDERLTLSGGEDTLFFLELTRRGGTLVWADDAVVHETVPASRARIRWILRRAYRGGNTYARCEAIAARGRSPVRRWCNRWARGSWRIVRGLAGLVTAPVRGRIAAVRSLRLVADGCGVLTALLGIGYDEYVHAHGD